MSLRSDVAATARYASDLRAFWRATDRWQDAPDETLTSTIRTWLGQRQESFLHMVRRHIFGHAPSPYLLLLQAAGIALEDVERLTAQVGIEGCLRRLYEAGVYVTLDEFKGRAPLQRLGLHLPVKTADFRTPRFAGGWDTVSGGTRTGRGTTVPDSVVDRLDTLPIYELHARAHGYARQPWAAWWAAPPGTAGMGRMLRHTKLGQRPLRWFSPSRPGLGAAGRSVPITWTLMAVSALMGHPLPFPRHTPIDRAEVVARWLADQKRRGRAVVFDAMASAAVRVALAAQARGLDISGHIFRTGGEPLTPAKAAVFARAGLRYCSQYASAETATLGLSCGDASADCAPAVEGDVAGSLDAARSVQTARPVRGPDDMHLLTYRLAFIQVSRSLAGWPEPVGALLVTRFSTYAPLVLFNLELGDYGVLEERECACPLGAAGLTTHLHTIRSYEKLTSAGMHFMGADLHDVLEVALPARFGGGPTDYQFVESEQGGQTILTLVISPTVGPLDEREAIRFTLAELERRTRAGRLMTDIWRQEGLLRIAREAPHLTRAAKIQPLHVEHGPP